MATEPTTDNRARARAFFERLADEESATVLVEALIEMLDDAERRGTAEDERRPLATDAFASGLTRDVVREYLRGHLQAVKEKPGVLGLAPYAMEGLVEGITRAVLTALDDFNRRAGEETDPIGPAAVEGSR